MATCEHCSRDLQAENFGEQNQLAILRQWLCDATCINWYESYSHVPDGCEQYGIIDVEESEILATPDKKIRTFRQVNAVDQDGNDIVKNCHVLNFTERLTITLMVYGDSGTLESCSSTKDGTPTRSSRDVLKHITLISHVSNMNDHNVYWLREAGTFVVRRVEQEDKDGNICGHRHEMTITLTICTESSYPEDGELFHWCVFTCEGKPLCLPKPEC